MNVRFVSLVLHFDCSYRDDTADKQDGGYNKTELIDSLLDIVLLLANIFPYLGVDHGVVFPDSVGPDEGDQRHLGHTETVIRRLLLFVGCPGN